MFRESPVSRLHVCILWSNCIFALELNLSSGTSLHFTMFRFAVDACDSEAKSARGSSQDGMLIFPHITVISLLAPCTVRSRGTSKYLHQYAIRICEEYRQMLKSVSR
jgi:hypothetical protein